jgi:hypothetical protein
MMMMDDGVVGGGELDLESRGENSGGSFLPDSYVV